MGPPLPAPPFPRPPLQPSSRTCANFAQACLASGDQASQLPQLRSEVKELIKFVALNYLGVVKAVKKRNKHHKVSGGMGFPRGRKGAAPIASRKRGALCAHPWAGLR